VLEDITKRLVGAKLRKAIKEQNAFPSDFLYLIEINQPMDSINEWHVKDTSANPAPLGLMAFGMTTVLLNLHNAGFFPLDYTQGL